MLNSSGYTHEKATLWQTEILIKTVIVQAFLILLFLYRSVDVPVIVLPAYLACLDLCAFVFTAKLVRYYPHKWLNPAIVDRGADSMICLYVKAIVAFRLYDSSIDLVMAGGPLYASALAGVLMGVLPFSKAERTVNQGRGVFRLLRGVLYLSVAASVEEYSGKLWIYVLWPVFYLSLFGLLGSVFSLLILFVKSVLIDCSLRQNLHLFWLNMLVSSYSMNTLLAVFTIETEADWLLVLFASTVASVPVLILTFAARGRTIEWLEDKDSTTQPTNSQNIKPVYFRLKSDNYFEVVDQVQEAHDEPADTRCMICWENKPNAILAACHHGGLCFQCASHLLETSASCPLCRAPLESVFETHPISKEYVKASRRLALR